MSLDNLAHMKRDTSAFEEVLRSGDLDARVDGCPGWDVRHLAIRPGGIHRWATARVEGRDDADALRGHSAPDGGALAGWFRAGAADLVTALRAHHRRDECWTIYPQAVVATLDAAAGSRDRAAAVGCRIPRGPRLSHRLESCGKTASSRSSRHIPPAAAAGPAVTAW